VAPAVDHEVEPPDVLVRVNAAAEAEDRRRAAGWKEGRQRGVEPEL
jgi:hypothetical protein